MHVYKCFPYVIHLVSLKILILQIISVFLVQVNPFAFTKNPFAKFLLLELPLNTLGAKAPTCKDDAVYFFANYLLSDCWSTKTQHLVL